MLHSVNDLNGMKAAGTDGEVGLVEDAYFDDLDWTIRHLVVGTGGWIGGRHVLVSPQAMRGVNWAGEVLQINLTRQQIENSPDIDTAKPVTRQQEAMLHDYYGLPYYWAGPHLWGAVIFPTMGDMYPSEEWDQGRQVERERQHQARKNENPHLRSSKEIIGYKIQATDDTVGQVEDLMFDDRDWSIRLIAVDTSGWWPEKSVLIPPQRIKNVSWAEKKLAVDLNRDEVEQCAEYDPANPPPFGPKYDLYRRFGMPHS